MTGHLEDRRAVCFPSSIRSLNNQTPPKELEQPTGTPMPLLPWRQAVSCGATRAAAMEMRAGMVLRSRPTLRETMPVSSKSEAERKKHKKKRGGAIHRDAVSRETLANSEHRSDRPEPVNGAPAGREFQAQ